MNKKKKKYPLLITSICCFVGSFVLFFIVTFITVTLNIVFKANGGGDAWFLIRRTIIPLIQIGVPILLIITSITLFFVSLFTEIIKE